MTYSYVYKIVNKINGKIYIGKANDPMKRRTRHFSTAKTGSNKNYKYQVIHKAINKYGKENFEFIIIEKCDSEKLAYERESFWIKELQTNDKNFGYNLNQGGFGGATPNDEVKKRISTSLSGRINSLEGLFKKLHKLFSLLPSYRENYKINAKLVLENKRLEKCKQYIIENNIIPFPLLDDDAKKTILNLSKVTFFNLEDIALAVGLELKTVKYVISRYRHTGVLTKEQKYANRSNCRKGKKLSEEHKIKISLGNKGKVMSEESKEKISKANAGESNGMFGKGQSKEAKEKMSKFHSERKRKPCSEEHKAKIKATIGGKKYPPIPQEKKDKVLEMWDSGNYVKRKIAEELLLKYNTVVNIIRYRDT